MSRKDDALLITLATPSNADDAARLLTHPIEQALSYCNARELDPVHGEFWRRLAGSLRKACTMI